MLLIVDDERNWLRLHDARYARTVAQAIEYLTNGEYSEVSLDHDLGPDEDVRALVDWMLHHVEHLDYIEYIYVHSMNPVGAEWVVKSLRTQFPNAIRIPLTAIGKLLEPEPRKDEQ